MFDVSTAALKAALTVEGEYMWEGPDAGSRQTRPLESDMRHSSLPSGKVLGGRKCKPYRNPTPEKAQKDKLSLVLVLTHGSTLVYLLVSLKKKKKQQFAAISCISS